MTVNINALTAAVASHAMKLGYFERFNGAEPTNAPGNGLTGASWVQDIQTASSGLSSTSMLLVFNVRLYLPVNNLQPDSLDPAMVQAIDGLFGAYIGDFTLGDLVRAVDVRGMEGTKLGGRAGYVEMDGIVYRVFTITLPLIVNDVWTEEA